MVPEKPQQKETNLIIMLFLRVSATNRIIGTKVCRLLNDLISLPNSMTIVPNKNLYLLECNGRCATLMIRNCFSHLSHLNSSFPLILSSFDSNSPSGGANIFIMLISLPELESFIYQDWVGAPARL